MATKFESEVMALFPTEWQLRSLLAQRRRENNFLRSLIRVYRNKAKQDEAAEQIRQAQARDNQRQNKEVQQ